MDDILVAVLGWLNELARREAVSITIDAETQLLEQNILTSIDFADLLDFLEGKYGFKAGADALTAENFLTPVALARLVERSLAK